jgi:Uma2 family endonuclease
VRLSNTHAATNRRVRTVVQPDLCVVCDPAKVDEFGCVGAPDWIVEIVSPGSVGHDTKTKFDLYEENGVGEYWIVVPAEKSVITYVLRQGRYESAGEYYQPGRIPCHTVPGLNLDWNDIFQPR